MIAQNGYQLPPNLHGTLARLCSAAAGLLEKAIDALTDMDPVAGRMLDEADDVVDGLVGQFYTQIASGDSNLHVDTAIELSRTGRYLERIADHAVNIGDHVTYIVTGSFPRHSIEALADED
jgi:phosphate transport system protein